MKTKRFLILALFVVVALVMGACPSPAGAPAAAPAGDEAAAAPIGDEYSTLNPILSDLAVRTAIAQCIDRDSLIASVYPSLTDEQKAVLQMDSFLPKTHWAYSGPYDFPALIPRRARPRWMVPGGRCPRATTFAPRMAYR